MRVCGVDVSLDVAVDAIANGVAVEVLGEEMKLFGLALLDNLEGRPEDQQCRMLRAVGLIIGARDK